MKDRTTYFTRLFIIIGVLLATLVAGTTYYAYYRDIGLQRVDAVDANFKRLSGASIKLQELESHLISYNHDNETTDKLQAIEIAKTLILETGFEDANESSSNEIPFEIRNQYVEIAQISKKAIEVLESDTSVYSVRYDTMLSNLNSVSLSTLVLSNKIVNNGLANNLEIRNSIKSSARSSMVLSFLTILMSILGIAYFIRLNSQNELVAKQNIQLAKRAEAGNHAKARLLTMLSHEIRTPMNGVLGLVSLGLQQRLPDGQRKLLEQVKCSSLELVTFLEDIVDFSDIVGEGKGKSQKGVTFTHSVSDRLSKKLETIVQRHGLEMQFEHVMPMPSIVYAENQRIEKLLFQVVSFIAKNTSEENILCKISMEESHWIWRMDLRMNEDAGEKFQLQSLVGDHSKSDNHIVSDTIETAMARGLIDALGGEIRLIHSKNHSDKYRLFISIPIQKIEKPSLLKVGFHNFTESKDRVTKYLFNDVPFEIIEPLDYAMADVIFCDVSTRDINLSVEHLRKIAPNAAITGIGSISNTEIFDEVVDLSDAEHSATINLS